MDYRGDPEFNEKRDYWKKVAVNLSLRGRNDGNSQLEQQAWSTYKNFRNKINNLKKMKSTDLKRKRLTILLTILQKLGRQLKDLWNGKKVVPLISCY